MMKKRISEIIILVFISLIFVAACIFNTKNTIQSQIKESATIDLDEEIELGLFFEGDVPYQAKFLTDITSIDTSVSATYRLAIKCDIVTEYVVLEITDLTPPVAEVIPQTYLIGTKFPLAEECVTNIKDKSDVTVAYQNVPDFAEAQTTELTVNLTDSYGNMSSYSVPFEILKDTTPPEIICENLTCNQGEKQGFISQIIVTDDYDLNPTLVADDSNVNYSVTGSYPVILSAYDRFGNETDKIYETVTVIDWSTAGADPDSEESYKFSYNAAYALAKPVYDSIITDDMTDIEKAYAVVTWVHANIEYVHKGPYTSVNDGAGFGFKYRQGDCYIYFSCTKFLLDMCGIQNLEVCRYPVIKTDHYWNLVYLDGQWWHCDSTRTYGHPTIYFMLTDEQLDSYHEFQHDAYPERATEISPYSLGGISLEEPEETVEETE